MPFPTNVPAMPRDARIELFLMPSDLSTTGGLYRITCFGPAGAPFRSTSFTSSLDQIGRQLARVGDGRRAADELGIGAVELADALQPPYDVGHVAAEHASVGVQLVDDDKLEVLEEPHPPGVMGQDSGVQHVGIGYHDMSRLSHGTARLGRRVSVIGEGLEVDLERLDQPMQLGELVLRQRLRRKQIEGAGAGVRA